jgi:putative methylase
VNQKILAKILSHLKQFARQNIRLEQYSTDAEIAAAALWFAYMHGDIDNKIIADLGSGTGILGLGALALNAKKAYLVEKDEDALKIARDNKKIIESILKKDVKAEFTNSDVADFNKKVDTVIQNPPFGVKQEHNDRQFLSRAMGVADVVYSFHKIESKSFVDRFAAERHFTVKNIVNMDMPLKATLPHHREKAHIVKVALWRLVNDACNTF